MALIISASLGGVLLLCIIFYLSKKFTKVRKRKTTADLGKILEQFKFLLLLVI